MSMFDELQASLQEAADIKHGKVQASRSFRHEVADVRAIRANLQVSQAEVVQVMVTND